MTVFIIALQPIVRRTTYVHSYNVSKCKATVVSALTGVDFLKSERRSTCCIGYSRSRAPCSTWGYNATAQWCAGCWKDSLDIRDVADVLPVNLGLGLWEPTPAVW